VCTIWQKVNSCLMQGAEITTSVLSVHNLAKSQILF
jgi:hypothetical protein